MVLGYEILEEYQKPDGCLGVPWGGAPTASAGLASPSMAERTALRPMKETISFTVER